MNIGAIPCNPACGWLNWVGVRHGSSQVGSGSLEEQTQGARRVGKEEHKLVVIIDAASIQTDQVIACAVTRRVCIEGKEGGRAVKHVRGKLNTTSILFSFFFLISELKKYLFDFFPILPR